jgi:hypothetical protein
MMGESEENGQGQWFMAVDAERGTLLTTIEAASVDEATSRFVAIAPLLGIVPAMPRGGLLWVPVQEPVDGPPAFRSRYFEALQRLVPPGQAAPGSTTIQ